MPHEVFEVILEKKGRGKGFSLSRPWTIRTFKLKNQTLEYWDRDVMKGTIDIKGAAAGVIPPAEADGREFGFAINTSNEKVILNASSNALREQCIEKFNIAANDPNWAKRKTKEEAEFESASKAATAAILAEEAEKARLQRELEALEAQRKEEVSASAASVFQENLADKAIEDARRAEEEQKASQQAEVMGLLGQANAKRRFREALAKGHMAVARGAAATMLQGAWRSKLAARQVKLKKAQKQRLLEDGYARKIQSRYRMRLAKRKIEKVKEEKRRIKEQLCARKVQCRWRVVMARRAYKRKQDAKMFAEYNKSIGRQRGLIKLQNVIRAFLATRRVAKIRVMLPTVVHATVLRADGLPCSETSEVGAIYSGMLLELPPDHPFLYRDNVTISEELIRTGHRVVSNFKVDNIQSKQEGLMCGPRSLDYVVVTLFDRMSPSKDEYLGQAVVRVADIVKGRTGPGNYTVEMTLPLLSKLAVHITDGGSGQLVTVRKAGSGTVTVSFTVLDPAFSISGHLYKVSESMLSNAWKKRWFVLADGQLQYFNSEYAMENSKNIVIMKSVTGLKTESYKGREGLKLSFTMADGKESFWMLDFDESVPPFLKRMWMKRIYANSPAIPDPAMERFSGRLAALNISGSSNSATSPIAGKTKTPMSKRMSIFS
jgi:hypothetical protein